MNRLLNCLKEYIINFIKNYKAQNIEMRALIIELEQALLTYETFFNDGTRFIRLEYIPRYVEQYTPLITRTAKLRKRIGKKYQQLISKAKQLKETFSVFEERAREHNAILAKQIGEKIGKQICPVEGRNLDEQQLACIAKESRNHLVVAGAGTGKTTTIVGYIKYLLFSEKCEPNEILVLSFTHDSAKEMRERIEKETAFELPVSTFHKLGLEIITRAQMVKPKITSINLKTFVSRELKELMKQEEYLSMLNQYVMANRVQGKTAFEFKSLKEYRSYLRENPPMTLLGETVKSYGEVDIANFLFEYGIQYVYEQEYCIDTRTEQYGIYKPDFYLPEYNIYIEYFGVNAQGEVPEYFSAREGMTPTQTYQESMQWKRNLHTKFKTKMIECYAYEKMAGTLQSELERKLSVYGVRLHKKSAKDIWKQINSDKNTDLIEGLVDLMQTVISLTKSKNYSIHDVTELNEKQETVGRKTNALLLKLIKPIFECYEKTLKQAGEIDFNDMINQATAIVAKGDYHHIYKYVLIDEYQDISNARFALINALRQDNEFDLFCVGDDWQSIYRFAGSDIGYILDFQQYWGISEFSKIETTYRFKKSSIDISGKFIMKNPLQIRKALKSTVDDEGFSAKELCGFDNDQIVEKINIELLQLPQGATVFFIGRYGFDINILKQKVRDGDPEKVREEYELYRDSATQSQCVLYKNRPDLKIQFLTAHRSKGLQADYVFILNNRDGRLGFPSKIQDAPILKLLLDGYDTYEYAEERRLFYVAMTRAKERTYLCTLAWKKSTFINELIKLYGKSISDGRSIDKHCPICGGQLIPRQGKNGAFYGCSNYSAGCRYTESFKNGDNPNVKNTIKTLDERV